jgi:dUTP pyrophosphatase
MSKKTVKIFNKGDNDLPNYATELSAGFDIRADLSRIYKIGDIVGDSNYFTLEVKDDGKKIITLLPHGRILIPTGLHVAIPEGYELQIRPRSGLALKNGITILNTPGTIDCFSEESLIKTIDGDKSINMLNINDVILSINNETLDIEKDVISAIVYTDEQEIIQIETEEGLLEVTPNTIIYTKNGLKKASEIELSDEIIII